jgi:hypothetical protein
MRKWRKIHLDGKEWKWFVGDWYIIIYSPWGEKITLSLPQFTGWTPDTIERAKWKEYFSIKPSDVRDYIMENLI